MLNKKIALFLLAASVSSAALAFTPCERACRLAYVRCAPSIDNPDHCEIEFAECVDACNGT